ncbi:MAG: hypothetical protein OXC30_01310 [Alphaproteobacteria bacterium]|nr:hypothetical protein [Alphaproteobacteria bacterium]
MTLILLFCVFFQSYAAQQRVQDNLSAHLPEEELEAFLSFNTKNKYTFKSLRQHAGYTHTLLKSRYDIADGELGLEMDPTEIGFSFSPALLCQAFFLMRKNYDLLKDPYPGQSIVWNDDENRKYSESYPLLISSAKLLLLSARKTAAEQKYTEWHSTFYNGDLEDLLAEFEEDARELNQEMLRFERRTSDKQ